MVKNYKSIVLALGLFLLMQGGVMADKENIEKISIFNAATGKVEQVEKIKKTNEEWKKILTPEQYRITRLKGTEKPDLDYCSLPKEAGVYQCIACGTDLFEVKTKFESGTG